MPATSEPHPRHRTRRLIAGAAAVLAVAIGAGSVPAAAAPDVAPERPDAAKRSQPPNVIVIVTDDQSNAMFERRYMPRTFRLLVDGGTWFTEAVAPT